MLGQDPNPQIEEIFQTLQNYCQRKGGPAASLNYPQNDTCQTSLSLQYLWRRPESPNDSQAQQLENNYLAQKFQKDALLQQLQTLCTQLGGKTYRASKTDSPVGICAKGLVVADLGNNIWAPSQPSNNPQVIQLENRVQQQQILIQKALEKVAQRCSDLAPNNSDVHYDETGCWAHPFQTVWSPSHPDPETVPLYSQLRALGIGGETINTQKMILLIAGILGTMLCLLIMFRAI